MEKELTTNNRELPILIIEMWLRIKTVFHSFHKSQKLKAIHAQAIASMIIRTLSMG
jgi:hypothetical protein